MTTGSEAQFGIEIPFVEHLGIRLLEQSRERAVITLKRRPELLNSWGAAHGGVIMTMLDLVMGIAVRGYHQESAGVLTVDISVAFLNASRDDITAEGRVLHTGRSTAFCEGEARDSEGQILSKAMGTFKLLSNKDVP